MHIKKILLFIISFAFSQNINSFIWNGTSISTSDNIDALNLNPAGLGINRDNQFGFIVQNIPVNRTNPYPLDNSNNSGEYIGFINRYINGWSTEFGYNSYTKKTNYGLGYGFVLLNNELLDNIYFGFSYKKNSSVTNYTENSKFDNFSYGLLFRPNNFISIGLTSFQGENSIGLFEDVNSAYSNQTYNYKYDRFGVAFRPFNNIEMLLNKKTSLSSITIGYDRTNNQTEYEVSEDYTLALDSDAVLINKKAYKEEYFFKISFLKGLDMTCSQYKNENGQKDLDLKFSFKFKTKGLTYSKYAANSFYGTNKTTNSFTYYNYNQDQDGFVFKNNENKTYIKIKLEGSFIEEQPYSSFLSSINPFGPKKGTQLKRWIDKIEEINEDEQVDGIIISIGNVSAGFAKRREIFKALMRLKENNKEIIVYSSNDISNLNYHLISMADEIYIHRMSSIGLKGLAIEPMFLKGLLDTLSLVPEVVRVSPYKSAFDTFLNTEMSDEYSENLNELLDDMYNILVADISLARGWDRKKTIEIIDKGPYLSSLNAKKAGLINDIMFPDEFNKYIDKKGKIKPAIINWDQHQTFDRYVEEWKPEKIDKVAIIYAVGGIMSGESNPGPGGSTIMGDKTIIKAIKDAREDKDIKAIILRVDSGGGSALASDMMWKEVYNTTVKDTVNKKPFIVSMSDVAASGGYYISCQADTILADEATITGSIGVIWARINFSKLLEKIGINRDIIKKGENSDFSSASHLLSIKEKEKIQTNIIDIYNIFKERVIEGRKNLDDLDKLDEIALGRVWSGSKAKKHGLVDITGGLYDAINVAKKSANISNDKDVEFIEMPIRREFSFIDLFSDKKTQSSIQLIDLNTFFPDKLAKELEVLEIIPVIMDNEIQFLMPYKIILD